MICHRCKRKITDQEIGRGYNDGSGPVYHCHCCVQKMEDTEPFESFESTMIYNGERVVFRRSKEKTYEN